MKKQLKFAPDKEYKITWHTSKIVKGSEAEEILNNDIPDKAEVIRRGFEICAYLYEIGELRLGHGLMSRLIEMSREIYGEFHPSQQAVYMYWLTWLYFLNDTNAGLDWVSRNKGLFLEKNSDPLNYFTARLLKYD